MSFLPSRSERSPIKTRYLPISFLLLCFVACASEEIGHYELLDSGAWVFVVEQVDSDGLIVCLEGGQRAVVPLLDQTSYGFDLVHLKEHRASKDPILAVVDEDGYANELHDTHPELVVARC